MEDAIRKIGIVLGAVRYNMLLQPRLLQLTAQQCLVVNLVFHYQDAFRREHYVNLDAKPSFRYEDNAIGGRTDSQLEICFGLNKPMP